MKKSFLILATLAVSLLAFPSPPVQSAGGLTPQESASFRTMLMKGTPAERKVVALAARNVMGAGVLTEKAAIARATRGMSKADARVWADLWKKMSPGQRRILTKMLVGTARMSPPSRPSGGPASSGGG